VNGSTEQQNDAVTRISALRLFESLHKELEAGGQQVNEDVEFQWLELVTSGTASKLLEESKTPPLAVSNREAAPGIKPSDLLKAFRTSWEHQKLTRDALLAPHTLDVRSLEGGGRVCLEAAVEPTDCVDFGLRHADGVFVFRTALFCNKSRRRVTLLSLSLEPPTESFTLVDDLGVATADCGAEVPPIGVLPIIVKLHARDAGGIQSAWLLATAIDEAGIAAAEEETKGGNTATLMKNCFRHCFVVGIRVAAVVVSQQRALYIKQLGLNPGAPPFVPQSLKQLFDAVPPWFFICKHNPFRVAAGNVVCAAAQAMQSCLAQLPPLAGNDKRGFFKTCTHLLKLLRVEEMTQVKALRAYDMFGVVLDPKYQNPTGCLYSLRVLGLPEHRPAVVRGDIVYLKPARDSYGVEIAVPVIYTQTKDSLVFVHIDHNLLPFLVARPDDLTILAHVRFSWDGSLFWRASQAMVAEANRSGAGPALLPTMPLPPLVVKCPVAWKPFHPTLNEQQQRLVQRVLTGHADGAPHVLFGPPGTGKTMTLVELTLHLYRARKRVLLCAPAPFAADLLCSRIAAMESTITKADMARVNDPRRTTAEVKSDVLPFCSYSFVTTPGDESRFGMPPDGQRTHLLWVASCSSAALIRDAYLGVGHPFDGQPFDAILCDEAGQATVPEALIPLCAPLSGPRTSIVLAGDPKQLGPIVHSRLASVRGLSLSLLERFAAASPPDVGEGCDKTVSQRALASARCRMTVLKANYRSHASVLALPSSQFYDNALVCCADAKQTAMPKSWEELHNGGTCRIHFHGVLGQQQREGESPSWHNTMEAAAVVDIVEGLIQHAGLQPVDFGVIALFRQQVYKIRFLLRSKGLGAVRVGTLDDYQGQEERVVIISTVVSRPPAATGPDASVQHDATSFLANPRRFNVAVTRAKALNIVIGHPVTLVAYEHWKKLISYAHARGAHTGAGAASDEVADGNGADDKSLAQAVRQVAQMSLLGGGRESSQASFEDAWADGGVFTGEELGFRVVL